MSLMLAFCLLLHVILFSAFFDLLSIGMLDVLLFCLIFSFDIGNGNIRIWKDYHQKDKQKLVTAFSSIQGHKPGVRCLNAVVDWQQQSGYLVHSDLCSCRI